VQVTLSSLPKRRAAGSVNRSRVAVPPPGLPMSRYPLRPENPRSTGPEAATPPASATEGRPVSTRCWECLVILVTAPVRPKQAGAPPSGLGMQFSGPGPPDPDSAT